MPGDVITLIANTGIQFCRFEFTVDQDQLRQHKVRFVEQFDIGRRRYWFDEVLPLPGEGDLWARRGELDAMGMITPSGKVNSKVRIQDVNAIRETDFFEVGNLNQVVRHFEKHWIPLPFFKSNRINASHFGPTDWVRMYFERGEDNSFQVCLLVDTSTVSDPARLEGPFLSDNPNENVYSIPTDDRHLFGFMDVEQGCDWVSDYLYNVCHREQAEIEQPFLRHLAEYLFLVRILRASAAVPQIQLLSDRMGDIDVEMVIDIGNTNTCVLLFESPSDPQFTFDRVKPLEIQDFERPLDAYNTSFTTRLVFKETDFGQGKMPLNLNQRFLWPSPVRVGKEAERTINDANVELRLSREVKTYHSSPKRYLWDDLPSDIEWEFHSDNAALPPRRVYHRGISEQLTTSGAISAEDDFGLQSMFSRRSLMTFVYLEIFSHAFRYINSSAFRSLHGQPSKRRRIRRVVITCPTAMIKFEQVALRQCAVDAMALLRNFRKTLGLDDEHASPYTETLDIIPSVRDLQLDLGNLERRKDWIFDESTCSQLVFLYALISRKFKGNADMLFKHFSKPSDTGRSLIVGSLDIGGGTSDLMICRYDEVRSDMIQLKPEPLFWESFNLAGDDLLQEIIRQIVIEGKENGPDDKGTVGVIENHGRRLGQDDITQKINGFFGKNSNNIGYRGRMMRVNFLNQVGIPVAYRYMEQANRTEELVMDYQQMFGRNQPNEELLREFESHFGFSIRDLSWKVSGRKVNAVIESVFGRLIQQVSMLMNAYGCDFIVLSGHPCAFRSLEALFSRYHPIGPHRLVNLNHYWIGRWYPFSDNDGFVADPKTVVCVGAVISLMSGTLMKLGEFRMDSSLLRTKLISTADYLGRVENAALQRPVLTPVIGEGTIDVFQFPVPVGFRAVNADQYPFRYLVMVDFDRERISSQLASRLGDDGKSIQEETEIIIQRVLRRMPLQIRLSRDVGRDKEDMKIEEVLDNERNEVPKSYFVLRKQTIPDQRGYWLDSGEFTLGIR